MSFFRYEAVDSTGKVVLGTMDAPTEAHVSARLSQMGFRAQAVAPAASFSRTAAKAQHATVTVKSSRLGPARARDLALFFRQFAALVRSGITLFQAMEHLAPQTRQLALQQTAREMGETARSGGRISDVMGRYPRLYASHVVASVRAGELGGFLDIVLDEIALDYEQDMAFYKGMAIPRALILQGLFALAVGVSVFPHVFPHQDWATFAKLVFLRNIPILLAILGLGYWWYRRLQEPENREKRDRLAVRTPVFGDLARQKEYVKTNTCTNPTTD